MFKGKTVLVSGAGGGLGQALCLRFSKAGAKIVALDIIQEGLDHLADQIKSIGGEVFTALCDITDETACKRISDEAGPVDIIINNAGITHFSRFSEMEPTTVQKVMTVNFFGAVNLTHAVLPSILERSGSVVAISSVAGFSPLYGRCGYSASKHAMQGFFDSLRSEVREADVHVMMVCPAFIATQTSGGSKSGNTARPGSATQTAGNPLTPEETAEAIFNGLAQRKEFLAVGKLAKTAFWVNKLFPKLFEKIMIKKMRVEIMGASG
ncbi:MAG: SDR family oxidoreductase [Rhodospirillales bacterium]|nr:SDR family oxidoreductase [Rhodospirillales bacterium]